MKQPKYVGESMKASATARDKGGSGHKYPRMKAGAASGPGRLEQAKFYAKKAK